MIKNWNYCCCYFQGYYSLSTRVSISISRSLPIFISIRFALYLSDPDISCTVTTQVFNLCERKQIQKSSIWEMKKISRSRSIFSDEVRLSFFYFHLIYLFLVPCPSCQPFCKSPRSSVVVLTEKDLNLVLGQKCLIYVKFFIFAIKRRKFVFENFCAKVNFCTCKCTIAIFIRFKRL